MVVFAFVLAAGEFVRELALERLDSLGAGFVFFVGGDDAAGDVLVLFAEVGERGVGEFALLLQGGVFLFEVADEGVFVGV